ncbi:hypothetical protein HC256_009098 [Beauveria bassiana]|nr:hypothetical protein HC256_009098 [Beauveria bassiana]
MPVPSAHLNPAPISRQSSPRRLRFVASDPDRGGLPVKRKHVQQACAICRHKKRRCTHGGHSGEAHAPTEPQEKAPSYTGIHQRTRRHERTKRKESRNDGNLNESPSISVSASAGQASTEDLAAQPREADLQRTTRFVCDSNPEALFVEATMEASAESTPRRRDVGVWVPDDAGNTGQLKMSRPPPIVDHILVPFVREHCLTTLPPDDDFCHFKAVYIKKIHPLFPVIPVSALDSSLHEPSDLLVRQLVCLAAAADPDLAPFLRLKNKGQDLLSAREYLEALSSSIRAIIETSLVTDRVLHIRALVVLSLYAQPTCADDADLPAQLGCRAVHLIFSLGMHHSLHDTPNADDMETLFCCVWAVDRINAATYGCPCFMHERDVGADLGSCMRRRPSCFRLLLSVVQWISQILDLYRPEQVSKQCSSPQINKCVDMPDFETMALDADALEVPLNLLATIETFYHAVVILSCKTPRSATTALSPSADARQSLAAERISCAVAREHLSPIHIVPYAASLALSVEYRKMRHCHLPLSRARAMVSFKRNCKMLQSYRDRFWSANVVATMAESVLREVERAVSALTQAGSPDHGDRQPSSSHLHQNGDNELPTNVLTDGLAAPVFGTEMDTTFDFSLFGAAGEDIFGYIDPTFDLNAVDNALATNLEIGVPFSWGDWDLPDT